MADPFGRLRRFLRELKRRNVYKVAVAYLAVAFVGIQAAQLLVPPTTLPAWADDLLIYLAVFGFPIALVVAWAFEMTPEGMRRTPGAEPAGPVEEEREASAGGTRTAYQVLVGLGLVATAIAGGWYLTGGGAESPEISEGTVAVLPFEVSGSGAETWRDGMVSLLSTGLDGAAGLRAIADRTVLATWEARGPGERRATTEEALGVAREVGAQHAVVGSASQVGGELQLTARLHETASGERLDKVEARGSPDSVTALANSLTRELLAVLFEESEGGVPSVDLASTTTSSLSALKSYLAGERHLRAADFEAAVKEYRRAVREDSTFALAYARLANAVGWAEQTATDLESHSWQRANEQADRLPARERRLLRAIFLDEEGLAIAAADTLRQLADDYPDDPAVWYWLGEAILHGGVPGGWPEADEAYRKAVALDPGHAPYFIHHIQLAIAYHHDSTLAAERAVSHPNPEAIESWFPVASALAFGDADRRKRTLARLDSAPSGDPPVVARMSLQHPDDRDSEEALIRRSFPDHPLYRTYLVQNLLRRGQVRGALDALPDPPAAKGVACGLTDALSLGYPIPDSVLRVHLDSSRVHGDRSLDRLYCRGIYLVEKDRNREFEQLLSRLRSRAEESADGPGRSAARAGAVLDALRGYRSWRAGDPKEAMELWSGSRPSAESRDSWEGIRRGDLLRELGHLDRSEGWYLTNWNHPLAHQRLGQLYEEMDKPEKAAAAYQRFIAAWEDADPQLQPRVEVARERLKKLTASEANTDD